MILTNIDPSQIEEELMRRDYLERLGNKIIKARTSFSAFVECVAPVLAPGGIYKPCPFTYIMCHALQWSWEKSKLLNQFVLACFNEPPQRGKSMHVSEMFPVWWLALSMNMQVIAVTGVEKLVKKMSNRSRKIINSFIFKAIFPEITFNTNENATFDWALTNGCTYKARGFDGSITGESGHLIIIDDIIKNRQEASNIKMMDDNWERFRTDIMSRQQNNTIMLMVQTRWGTDDLTGKVLNMIEEDRRTHADTGEPLAIPNFVHISFKEMSEGFEYYDKNQAKIICVDSPIPDHKQMGLMLFRKPDELLHPQLHDMAEYRRTKLFYMSGGDGTQTLADFYALYQQEPIPSTGSLFNPEKFNYYTPSASTLDLSLCHIITGCDFAISTANTADNNAFLTIAVTPEKHWYIIGLELFKGSELIPTRMLENARRFMKMGATYTLAYEQHNIYMTLEAAIKYEFNKANVIVKMHGVKPIRDKAARSFTAQTYVNAGRVYLPDSDSKYTKHRDILNLVREFAAFTGASGGKDDIVDSLSIASVPADKLRPIRSSAMKTYDDIKKKAWNKRSASRGGYMVA